MATYTETAADFIRPYRNVKSTTMTEGASQSFKKGTPLIQAAAHVEATGVITFATDSRTKIVGVAAEDATGVTGSKLNVWLVGGDAEFRGIITNNNSGVVLDGAQVGTEYGLIVDGSALGIWKVDTNDTSNVVVMVTGLISPEGDTGGYVSFRFKKVADAEATIRA